MTVKTAVGAPVFGPADFQRTDRGITWGIKVTDLPGLTNVGVFLLKNGVWVFGGTVEAHLDDDLPSSVAGVGGSMTRWFNEILLPALNKWLKVTFPAIAGGVKPPVLTPAEQADKLIGALQIVTNADGTLTAVAP